MMKSKSLKPIILVGLLFVLTCIAMAYDGEKKPQGDTEPVNSTHASGVSLSGNMTRSKVLVGGDGLVSLGLTLMAEPGDAAVGDHFADVVVVLDQSGSMDGEKLASGKRALSLLIKSLSSSDRFALVGYSDGVTKYSELSGVTGQVREELTRVIGGIRAGGSTNLSGGLEEGIRILKTAESGKNIKRVILISDGLANRGVVDPMAISAIASMAAESGISVSSVGVGLDFNEQLMTSIADRGMGTYRFLENPDAFAEAFRQEFCSLRRTAASKIEISVPKAPGMTLVDASGYPVTKKDGGYSFYPGSLLSGGSRGFFLTFRVPVSKPREFSVPGISVSFDPSGHDAKRETLSLQPFHLSCVGDSKAVYASYRKKVWEEKVLQEDYGKLRERVALEVKKGKKDSAMAMIADYRKEVGSVNSVIKSEKVEKNVGRELEGLTHMVEETFSGSRQQVMEKQKTNAKVLQYDAYRERRKK